MMSKIASDPRFATCYHLFPGSESKNLNHLVLIHFGIARARLSGFAGRACKSAV
jgi:hypothetical protein